MKTYRNIKTGAVFTSECEISGALWEEVKPNAPEVPKEDEIPEDEKPKRKRK